MITNKIPLFILTYKGLDYFQQWFDASLLEHVSLFIIDNGRQRKGLPNKLHWNSNQHYFYYSTTYNIGCAGGWNLCAKIGFRKLAYQKILIGQDDARFNLEMLERVYHNTNENTITGAYGRGFTFSLFGLHSTVWQTLGEFDENIVFVTNEDADYTQRAYRKNIEVKSLEYNADLNKSLVSSSEEINHPRKLNQEYMNEKWGLPDWKNPLPFNQFQINDLMPFHQNFLNAYGRMSEYPSETEYKEFKYDYDNIR